MGEIYNSDFKFIELDRFRTESVNQELVYIS